MADIFTKNDAQKVVEYKVIWFWGDSNIRAVYKDLVWLLQRNSLIDQSVLRNRLEASFMNDYLIKGEMLHKGRSYTEVRVFENFAIPTKIEFMFLTECLSDDVREKIQTYHATETPDIIIMNSCLWDITRWGPEGVTRYKQNIRELLKLFREYLPSKTLVIWTTTPPLSSEPQGGFLIKQINFMKPFLRFEVMEANMYVREEVVKFGFDVLDIHYHLMLQIHRRRPDGIHWNPDAVRHVTNLILTHISLSYRMPLPGNFASPILDKIVRAENEGFWNGNSEKKKAVINSKDENNNQKIACTVQTGDIGDNNQDANTKNNNCNVGIASKKKTSKKRKRNKRNWANSLNDQNMAPPNLGWYPLNNNLAVQNLNFKINRKHSTRHCNNFRPY
ncbi:UNVERIFIED_CONTAM: hypothetical protein PYX00_007729 [Menopon gallinae]|uniref:PC-esterase domain-containing protein 1A n=1 Tax=Menopon gallinae TaxID=328185 RepID=A0AAW2HK43_9NEOP